MHALSFIVQGKPQGKARPRFTSTGRVYTATKTKEYEELIKDSFIYKYGNAHEVDEESCFKVEILIYHAIPRKFNKATQKKAIKGEMKPKTKPDIDNVAKVVLDALNGLVYKDDKQVTELIVKKLYDVEEGLLVGVSPVLN